MSVLYTIDYLQPGKGWRDFARFHSYSEDFGNNPEWALRWAIKMGGILCQQTKEKISWRVWHYENINNRLRRILDARGSSD